MFFNTNDKKPPIRSVIPSTLLNWRHTQHCTIFFAYFRHFNTFPINMRLDLRNIADFAKFKDTYSQRIRNHCQRSDDTGCLVWKRCVRKGYGAIKVSYTENNGSKCIITTSPHKVLYMCIYDIQYIEENVECSHLCGNKLCCEATHIVIESSSKNHERNTCHKDGFCSKQHRPLCIIH